MLVPVVCFVCGGCIGDVELIYRHERAKLVRKSLLERNIDPTVAAIGADTQTDCSELMTLLGIESDCCRTHLATAIRFQDIY